MKFTKLIAAVAFTLALSLTVAMADDKKKKDYAKGSCCAKAAAKGEACAHPCCVEAEKAGKVCEKCNKKKDK